MAGETVSGRERALLRAVAEGRCELEEGPGAVLLVDGLTCADSAAAFHLVQAGLIAAAGAGVPAAVLTEAGYAVLEAV
ncbi:hypothetical protein [Pseudonocardia sp.]|uniref:hypothetical protein n=1 Tax=Pseudonocardia sp. TaxID=60912 RepID=UPI003D115FF1